MLCVQARLPPRATNCRKRKCGHSSQLRPKKKLSKHALHAGGKGADLRLVFFRVIVLPPASVVVSGSGGGHSTVDDCKGACNAVISLEHESETERDRRKCILASESMGILRQSAHWVHGFEVEFGRWE